MKGVIRSDLGYRFRAPEIRKVQPNFSDILAQSAMLAISTSNIVFRTSGTLLFSARHPESSAEVARSGLSILCARDPEHSIEFERSPGVRQGAMAKDPEPFNSEPIHKCKTNIA